MSIPRWVCPSCRANNMPQSAHCFSCGTAQPLWRPPAPVYHPPQVAPAAPVTDACAIASLVFGALGLVFFCFFGWVFALVSLALGAVSLWRLRDRRFTGAPLAVTGMALSVLPLVWALGTLWFFAQLSRAAEEAQKQLPPLPVSPGYPR